jgi:hypothetical protein
VNGVEEAKEYLLKSLTNEKIKRLADKVEKKEIHIYYALLEHCIERLEKAKIQDAQKAERESERIARDKGLLDDVIERRLVRLEDYVSKLLQAKQ